LIAYQSIISRWITLQSNVVIFINTDYIFSLWSLKGCKTQIYLSLMRCLEIWCSAVVLNTFILETHLVHVLIKHVCIHFVSNVIARIHCFFPFPPREKRWNLIHNLWYFFSKLLFYSLHKTIHNYLDGDNQFHGRRIFITTVN
jgi:hypothetical protein